MGITRWLEGSDQWSRLAKRNGKRELALWDQSPFLENGSTLLGQRANVLAFIAA